MGARALRVTFRGSAELAPGPKSYVRGSVSLLPFLRELSWTSSSPAASCSLRAPLLPIPPFFCRVSSPLTTTRCWVNHPSLAGCPSGPFLLLEEQICNQSGPRALTRPTGSCRKCHSVP